MAQFTVNAQRFDPYKNFKFRVKWDGRFVAGISKCSALKRTTEVVEHREGGDPSTSHKSPGRTKFEAITLERGVTHDLEFEKWANKVWNFGAGLGSESSLKDFRKELIIGLYNQAGQRHRLPKLRRAARIRARRRDAAGRRARRRRVPREGAALPAADLPRSSRGGPLRDQRGRRANPGTSVLPGDHAADDGAGAP